VKTDGGGFTSSGGGFRKPRPAPLAFSGYRALACAVVADAVSILRKPVKTRHGEAMRTFEIDFFRDPARASKWCEMAGWDLDAVVSKLDKAGLLEEPAMGIEEAARVLETPEPRAPIRAPKGAYNGPQIGIGRVETALPYNPDRAVTAMYLATRLGITQQYANRALLALRNKGRAANAGKAPRSAPGEKQAWLWYRVRK
jgi:hypothetical protein